jgi:hypothetical protein
MILWNNGYRKDGITPSTVKTPGAGMLYIPALDATFLVSWKSIGKYHLDISPDDEGMGRIVTHFGFTMENPGTKAAWEAKKAWDPVEAYLEFNGRIVAGSINLLPRRGSGESATLNLTAGYGLLCFYTYNSKQANPKPSSLVIKHQAVAVAAFNFAVKMAKSLVDWLVRK